MDYLTEIIATITRKNRPLDQKPEFLGEKKTILGHIFRKSLLSRPKSVKTDHITHTDFETKMIWRQV